MDLETSLALSVKMLSYDTVNAVSGTDYVYITFGGGATFTAPTSTADWDMTPPTNPTAISSAQTLTMKVPIKFPMPITTTASAHSVEVNVPTQHRAFGSAADGERSPLSSTLASDVTLTLEPAGTALTVNSIVPPVSGDTGDLTILFAASSPVATADGAYLQIVLNNYQMQSTTIAITNHVVTFMVFHRNNACDLVNLGTNSLGTTRYGCYATLPTTATVATWPTPDTAVALTVTPTVLFGDGVVAGSVAYKISVTAATSFKVYAASTGTTALTITASNGTKDTESIITCFND